MLRIYRRYEEQEARRGLMDFEDLLERAIEALDDEQRSAEFRERYLAFTVDEYQDVNLLQQTLLERWLGPRDDLCVVGDDYQSIYGFTGADARVPAAIPERAQVFRLEENYRSTPQVLALANRLVPKLGGAEKTLRATRPDGPEPEVQAVPVAGGRGGAPRRADPRRRLRARGDRAALPHARAARRLRGGPARRRDPLAGRGAADREAARRLLRVLDDAAPAAERVRAIALDLGWLPFSRPTTSSASARRRGRGTSGGSSGWPRSSAAAGRSSAPSSSSGSATAASRGAASTCSPTTAPRGSSSRSCSCRGSRRRSCPSKQAEERSRDRRGAAPLLRRADAGEAAADGHVGAASRAASSPSSTGASAPRRGAADDARGLRGAEGVAARAGAGRRGPGVRRLPQRDARGDRRRAGRRARRARGRSPASAPRSSSATARMS